MLRLEHSAVLLTFIKLPVVIKIFVLSIYFLRGRFTQVYCMFEEWLYACAISTKISGAGQYIFLKKKEN